MARYTLASCKLCRRHGDKLFLKGMRCQTDKCAINKRPFAPGQHGKARKKVTDYGQQVREKQKVKRTYGVLEKQFRKYFAMATKSKGVTGEVLLQLLERRLDNVIFKSCFALSRAQARMIVRHRLVRLNGRPVNIPSILVKPGDKIEIKNREGIRKKVKETIEVLTDRPIPDWMKRDKDAFSLEIQKLPVRQDVGFPVNENLIVELYSK